MSVDKKVKNPRAKNADENENRLFLDILKTAKSGKLWKIITEGTPKRQESHDVWVTAAEIFSKESGKEMSWTQAKSKWFRLKQIARKKADKTHSDREYRKLASKTGGGHLPPLPPEEDPDDGNNDLDMINDSVPIETGFNELVRPQDRVTSLAGGSCTPRHDTPLSMARSRVSLSQPSRLSSPLPSLRLLQSQNRLQGTMPSSSVAGIRARSVHSPAPSVCSTKGPALKIIENNPVSIVEEDEQINDLEDSQNRETDDSLPEVNGNRSYVDKQIDNDQVLIIDGDGKRLVVDKSVPLTNKAAKKKSKKRNVNEEGANYYNRMLEIQEELSKDRLEVLKLKKIWLKKKIENEQLMKVWIQKKIVDGNGDDEVSNKIGTDDVSDESQSSFDDALFDS